MEARRVGSITRRMAGSWGKRSVALRTESWFPPPVEEKVRHDRDLWLIR